MRTSVHLLLLAGVTLAAADHKTVSRTVPVDPKGDVRIDTYKGRVHVTTWDQAQVEIHATIEPDGFGFSDAVDRTEVKIDASQSSIRIKSDYSRLSFRNWGFTGSNPFVNYTIRMPRTANLSIKDYKSEIEVSGLRSSLDIESYKGEMRVRDIDGGVRLNTYKGTARTEFANYTARSSFETYKGEIEISMPGSSRFDLRADLGKRASLRSDFDVPQRSRGRTEFRAEVNGDGPLLSLKSYRGEFTLRR